MTESFIPAQDHPFPDELVVWLKRGSNTWPVIIDGLGWQSSREHMGGIAPLSWLPGDLIAPVAGQWVPVPEGVDPERLVGERMRWESKGSAHEVVVEKVSAGILANVNRALVSPEALARITADPDAELRQEIGAVLDCAVLDGRWTPKTVDRLVELVKREAGR